MPEPFVDAAVSGDSAAHAGARVCVVDAEAEPPRVDLAAADRWQFLVTAAGTPCSYVKVPSPGRTSGSRLTEALLFPRADLVRAQERLAAHLRGRLDKSSRRFVRRTCSVVVCTHRRRDLLEDLIVSLGHLDPPADEVIVVDNDPADQDCRELVEATGFRYVREDRRGLNRGRLAGLRAARGELVAFTDDDCLVPPGWLRSLPELFDDDSVGAVTGPALAHSLETAAMEAREKHIYFNQGFARRVFDWTVLPPYNAGAVGAGVNMIFRRRLLCDLSGVFPPELDAGTLTLSGGDLYALYRVLEAGHRVVYDPATYLFHRHAPASASVHATAFSYGVGFSSFLTRALVRHGELGGFRLWPWVWRTYKRSVLLGVIGEADPGEVRLRLNYLRGGLRGPLAWTRSRLEAVRSGRDHAPLRAGPDAARQVQGAGTEAAVDALWTAPKASVEPQEAMAEASSSPCLSMILTGGSSDAAVSRSLAAVAEDLPAETSVELVLATASAGNAPAKLAASRNLQTRSVPPQPTAADSRNAAVAAASGKLIIFLDADLTAAPGLVAAHARAHASGDTDRIVVGRVEIEPGQRLAERWAALDRAGRERHRRGAAALTFSDVSFENLSLPRRLFERVGTLDARLGDAGADREWAIRALDGGIDLEHEPAAVARGSPTADARRLLTAARVMGRTDAELLRRHPEATPSLVAGRRPAQPGLAPAVLAVATGLPGGSAWPVAALNLLEATRSRAPWLAVVRAAEQSEYRRGFVEAAGRYPPAADLPVLRVELTSDEPIAAPGSCPPVLEVRARGVPVARLWPPNGQWPVSIADEIATALGKTARDKLVELFGPDHGRRDEIAGMAVLLGAARRRGDDRHRAAFADAGVRVVAADGDKHEHWTLLDRAIREASEEIVALPLPGVAATPSWLAQIAPAFDGEAVGMAIGAGLREGERRRPLQLLGHRALANYRTEWWAPQFLVLRRAAYLALGGFDLSTARFGPQAPILDLCERGSTSGYVVAYRETTGLAPPGVHRPARSRNEWDRWKAKGALRMRRARELGGARGRTWFALRALGPRALFLWTTLRWGSPSLRHWVGSTAAFAYGSTLSLREGRQRPRQR